MSLNTNDFHFKQKFIKQIFNPTRVIILTIVHYSSLLQIVDDGFLAVVYVSKEMKLVSSIGYILKLMRLSFCMCAQISVTLFHGHTAHLSFTNE